MKHISFFLKNVDLTVGFVYNISKKLIGFLIEAFVGSACRKKIEEIVRGLSDEPVIKNRRN